MLTDFARDHAFTIAWFGLMIIVWCGWGQEDPPPGWRGWLGLSSVIGGVVAGAFGYGVFLRWAEDSALDGQYVWFGVLTGAQAVLAGAGALYLWRRRRPRWISWWVALIVAAHFIPLALLLSDWSLVALGSVKAVGLVVLGRAAQRGSRPLSRSVCPYMGGTLTLFALASSVLFVTGRGWPWGP